MSRVRKGKAAARPQGRGATRKVAQQKPRRDLSVWVNRVLILFGSGVVMVAAVQALVTLMNLPVRQISITGEMEHTRTEAVQDMVQSALAGGFLRADLQRIREQLEGLPWIYQATVRRKWPSSLDIHVVEQLPVARWGGDGFLNHEGEVFRSGKSDQWQSLPLLQGPPGTAPALTANYQRLMELLKPLDLEVRQLAVDERGQVEAVLAGDLRVVLGSEDFLERTKRFVALYRRELAERAGDVARVDLRYESGVAVAFRGEPSHVAGL